jgi:hypothetical protein
MFALVYMDSPLLNACTLIDVPGYQDTESDANLAVSLASHADIVIYTSPAKGFIDQADFLHLSQLLRALSPIHEADKGLHFANFFLVATHADRSISDLDLEKIKRLGAQRLHEQLGKSLFREEPRKLSIDDIANRIFTFWFEIKARRQQLEDGLLITLSSVMPNVIRQQIDGEVKQIKARTRADLRKRIDAYKDASKEIDAARQTVARLLNCNRAHKEEVQRNKAVFKGEVDQLKRATEQFIFDEITPMLTVESVNSFLDNHYASKDDAKRDAVTKLLETVQSKLETFIKNESEKLLPLVEKYLQKYEVTPDCPKKQQFGRFEAIPFDVQGAFAGGLIAAGSLETLGTLAAAMGTLGGLASLLSIAGFEVGSASLVTGVSLIGGPVTLSVGLASVLALGIWSLFVKDWKTPLAKKISKTLNDKGLLTKLREQSDAFWDTTWTAFEVGADAIEEKFDEYLKRNDDLLKGKDSTGKLETAIATLEDLRDFFGGIPWRTST